MSEAPAVEEDLRCPLRLGAVVIGSVATGVIESVAGSALLRGCLQVVQDSGGDAAAMAPGMSPGMAPMHAPDPARGRGPHPPAWRLQPHEGMAPDDALDALARVLCEAGLGGRWRGERLAVRGPDGVRVAAIERAVVRTLGIATWAVHLMGFTTDGRVWLQQRAWDKADDPGLWDTLVGGMVPDGETAESALIRETAEEAGLDLAGLLGLHPGGVVRSRRPTGHAQGRGLLVERLDWFRAVLPEGLQPVNRDGEVAQFACVPPDEARFWLAQGRFTQDAAAILGQALA